MPLWPIFKKKEAPQAGTTATDPATAMRHSASNSGNARASSSSDPDTLADGFGGLRLGPEQRRRQEGGRPTVNPMFVGGFAPSPHKRPDAMDWEPIPPSRPPAGGGSNGAPVGGFPTPQPYPTPPPGPLPTPPAMPTPVLHPMSRTMAYAMTEQDSPSIPPPPPPPKQNLRPPASAQAARPHSDSSFFPSRNHLQVPPTTPQRPHLQPAPNSAPAKPTSSGPSRSSPQPAQTPPRRARAQSSPPSPTSVTISFSGKNVPKVQCCAITKQDKRCTRKIPVSNPLALLNGDEEPQFCHQHIKSAFIDVKFPSHKLPGVDVDYADWVPEYLQESTKTVLREEMQKKASAADEDGYIYAYEIDDDTDPDVVHIKVGRAVKLTKRLAEWDKQCQSKQTHLRGYWPMSKDAADGGMMRGRLQVGPPGPYCHRVERLVHLELADIALNAPYLDPMFPNVKADIGNGNRRSATRDPCPDCGAVHKEIFTFPRATGRYKGKEWEEIVRPVIEKWGGFVETYV